MLVASPAAGQESDSATAEQVRITARKLDDGRIEFGLQQRATSADAWGQRQLPRSRFFPTSATVGRWLNSSPLATTATAPATTAGSQYTAVSASAGYTCAITTSGAIACWGADDGTGRTEAPDGAYSAITTADRHACALGSDNTIECWGASMSP